MAIATTAPRPRAHVRDGLALGCVGLAGWGAAPLIDRPGLALPALAIGTLTGAGVITFGQRSARRAELVNYLNENLAPLLGANNRSRGPARVKGWTRGWPGVPRRVHLRYGVGRIRLGADPTAITGSSSSATVELGDNRWVSEISRQVGRRFGADYAVDHNDPVRGRLVLKLRPAAEEKGETPETPQLSRAKKVVNELLAGTATIGKVEVDEATGEVRRLEVKHEVGAKLVASGYRARVERTLSVMLPGRWRARWDMEGDSVVFEVRPTLPESLWIPPLELPDDDPLHNYRQVRIPYGVDEDGEVIAWQPAINPQWLITGGTGSGKTSTGHGILTQITQFGWPVWIADGKGIEFLGFQDWPNVQIVASEIAQQVAVIHRAWQLMEYRYQLVVERRARTEDFEPLMVFVDEFTDLKANLLTWYAQIKVKGDPTKPATLSEVGSIARKGRTARVHLVLSMQRPDADILTGEARENFGQRTSMGPLSPQGAEMMWNSPVVGVTIPRGRTGRAIGTNNLGVPVEMQAYRVPDPKDASPGTPEGELIEKLRPREARHERLLIVSPEVDWSGDEPCEPTFSDFAGAEWVKAADRPDLDPLAQRDSDGDAADADGRALSSPLTLLGLNGTTVPSVPASSRRSVVEDLNESAGMSPVFSSSAAIDDDLYADGYGQPSGTRASMLAIGDLIRVDEDLDAWAVVEEEPVEDFDDPDFLVIAWRDDQDNSGQLSLPSEAFIQARRPI
ncbi:type IV secretory system conjugative DNA transfer family protein [Nocardioides limicola]|uniref:type IV secretory system conjugative DNA transfer family protein n=1 Tax=Nocardioides limicola TaxID=2803368 RepID=UPI00193B82C1|nr:hypothetical protein [Nocardioides sp. DJM-14]